MSLGLRAGSLLAERKAATQTGGDHFDEISLARVVATEEAARSWRITLGRIDRADDLPPLVIGGATTSASIFVGKLYGYAAGQELTPAAPPRRSNSYAQAGDVFGRHVVQIAWGMDGARAHRLIAHWPAQGGSIVVVGNYAEVWAGAAIPAGATAQDIPVFEATIAPTMGVYTDDGGELSIQQLQALDTVTNGNRAVFYVPDFARRVRVVGVEDATLAPPDPGHLPVRLKWFDDLGVVCGSDLQGRCIAEVAWHPVPARAVMLEVSPITSPPVVASSIFAHWRVAP